MSKRKTDISTSSRPQYTRSYSEVRGVDFSSDPSRVAEVRSPNLLNMYRDYDSEHGAAIETIPGYRRLFDFGAEVHGIWGYSSSQDELREEYVIVHAGTKLYSFLLEKRDDGVYEECFDGLADTKSSAFLQNNNFYICDGNGIYVMSPATDGEKAFSVVSLEEAAYIPITYLAGGAYEQRNMLTDAFINRDSAIVIEKYGDLEDFKVETKEQYESYLTNYDYELDTRYENNYNHHYYTLKKNLNTRVFDELDVRFLQSLYDSIDSEGDCRRHIELSKDMFADGNIKRIYTQEPVSDEIKDLVDEVFYGEASPIYDKFVADVVIYEPCLELSKVTVNGKEIPEYEKGITDDVFYIPVREKLIIDGDEKWYIAFIHIYASSRSELDTLEVDIYGTAEPVKIQKSGSAAKHTDYLNSNKEYEGSSKEAILGCGISATFDGRVFLTGNKKLPNTVFYSCRDLTGYNNPAYFGVYNYFNDGVDNSPNVALLSTSSILMVLKGNTISGSAIYYHSAADGVDDVVPRIYPSVPGVAGLGCKGAAINFLDDAVFISDRGLEGVSKEALNSERTIGHRSSMIDRILKVNGGDVLGGVTMCRFGGYLCLINGMGHMFLGDSRQLFQGVDGAYEYEWFYLKGIGAYRGDYKRYRTVTVLPSMLEGDFIGNQQLEASEETQYVEASELMYGETRDNGYMVYYVERDGRLYLCDTDGELEGGEFFPACVGYSVHGIMFFGTTGGQICCFNTDKRGQSVGDVVVDADRIHRSFYSFAGHRYYSWVAFKSDNCGAPHLTKRTSRKTCVVKLKAMAGSRVTVKVRTDRESWEEVDTSQSNNIFSFDDLDFDNFTFNSDDDSIVVVKDKKKKWVEKQFLLCSDGYLSPFGLYGLSYNYEIQGRVKK